MPGVVAYIDQRLQLGQESAPGTPAAANRRMQQLALEMSDELDTVQFNPTGHRLDALSLINKAWTGLKGSGPMSYTESLLLLEAWLGTVAPSTVGVNGKRRIYDLPLSGAPTPKTLTAQFGDDTYANEAAYCFFSSWGAKYNREDGSNLDGLEGYALRTKDGGTTFTGAPTTYPLTPMMGPHLNFYIATTYAGLDTGQITEEVLEAGWNVKDMLKVFWAADRAQRSWKKSLSSESGKYTASLSLGESAATRAIDAWLMLGRTYLLRIDNKGGCVDNRWTIGKSGAPTGGSFTLTFKGQTTGAITYNSSTHHPTAAEVQQALEGLSSIGVGNVVCTGGPLDGTDVVASFEGGALVDDMSALTHTDSLTPSGAITVAATQTQYQHTAELALKLMGKSPWANKGSVYARDFDFTIVEDATWGHGLQITSMTGLASL